MSQPLPPAFKSLGSGWVKVTCLIREESVSEVDTAFRVVLALLGRRSRNPTCANGQALLGAAREVISSYPELAAQIDAPAAPSPPVTQKAA